MCGRIVGMRGMSVLMCSPRSALEAGTLGPGARGRSGHRYDTACPEMTRMVAVLVCRLIPACFVWRILLTLRGLRSTPPCPRPPLGPAHPRSCVAMHARPVPRLLCRCQAPPNDPRRAQAVPAVQTGGHREPPLGANRRYSRCPLWASRGCCRAHQLPFPSPDCAGEVARGPPRANRDADEAGVVL